MSTDDANVQDASINDTTPATTPELKATAWLLKNKKGQRRGHRAYVTRLF